jgi:SPOR domain
MADSSSGTFRRDALARDTEPSPHGSVADPLAELARLIGQTDPHGGHSGQPPETYEESASASGFDWASHDDREGEHRDQAEEAYPASPSANSYHSQGPGDAGWGRAPGFDEEPPTDRQSLPPPSFLDGRGDPRWGRQDTHDRGDTRPPASRSEPLPYIPPGNSGTYPADEQRQYGTQSPAYDADDARDEYGDDARAPRRSGTVVVVAVLGLVVLGVAGALGYRAMFGGSMIPSLPPIIKPGDKPIKIVPNQQAQAGGSGQGDVGGGRTGEQLVPHQETPVDVQPANPAPRMVTTIPIISNAPEAPLPGAQPAAGEESPTSPSAIAGPNNSGPPVGTPNQAASPPVGTPAPGSRPVRTVIIRPGQPSPAANPAAEEAPPSAPPTHPTRAPRPIARSGVPTASAGPLSIIPGQQDTAPPRTHTALAHSPAPMPLSSPPAQRVPATGGGYAVQVTSQRSEADAEAAFRALQGKYPQQLGGRRALIRRADLGAKGIYFRAEVGPFASAEQAAGLCTSIKAAGGNCIVQRD